ncbi:MAG: zinc ABC transporter permease subunit ZnuB [Cellvibrionaceae bacterium]
MIDFLSTQALLPSFLLNALLVGIGVALLAGPLGCFVVWRRMSYLGDTLAHSGLLGVALGLLLSININFAIVFICSALALVFVLLQHNRSLATDTLLGILAHSSLALGLIAVGLLEDARVDLYGYLFGDLLATSAKDVIVIYGVCIAVLAVIVIFWRQLLAITVHSDLAKVEGVNVTLVITLLMLVLAIVIAIAMKVVGVLLITALLIIPAAASRRLSSSPEQMAIVAAILAIASVLGGLTSSYFWDTATGPSIVLTASCLFLFSLCKPQSV